MSVNTGCKQRVASHRGRSNEVHPSSLICAMQMHAVSQPEATAIVEMHEGGRTCSWSDLMQLTTQRAVALRQHVEIGQTLITALPSGIESIGWFCGAIAAGVRILPMHTQVAAAEAGAAMDQAGAVAAVSAPGIRAARTLRRLTTVPLNGGGAAGTNDTCPAEATGAVILESSGTSGLPKLVLRESTALDAVAQSVRTGLTLCADDRIVFPTPLSHSYGVDVLVAAITSGATLCVMNQFDPDRVAREIESAATILLGVPFIYESLARQSSKRTSTLRVALSAGSPLLNLVRSRFGEAWSVDVGQLYGTTELGTVAMSIPGTHSDTPGSIGPPLPGVEMSIVDIEDPSIRVAAGEEGQLLVRAPSMLTACLNGDVDRVQGHLMTGDLARMDDHGHVWITGRLKLMVDVGGYKVNPLEVEAVLASHPAVQEAVVVPIVQSPTIRRLRAVVVLRDDSPRLSGDQLRAFLKDRLSVAKVPRIVNFVSSLPKSSTGKIQRAQIVSDWI